MRTFGVEEELLLVDQDTGAPVPFAGRILGSGNASTGGGRSAGMPWMTAEFKQEQIEVLTMPCTGLGELLGEIRAGRDRADAAARGLGARAAALSTSPVPAETHTSPSPRFDSMMEEYGLTAREQLTCGMHVHVGIGSAEEGVGVMDRIRAWLPVLTALSANSPFWQGSDSGYASYRTQAWSRWPTAGPTEILGSAAGYEGLLERLLGTGVPLDEGMMYFDVRLSRAHPTVEVRVADVCLLPGDAAVLAGLVRALVETASREWAEGTPPPQVPSAVLRLAAWRASRAGTNGALLDPGTHRPASAARVIASLLEYVRPALAATGDLHEVRSGLDAILRRGSGERRQRDTYRRTGSLAQVALDAAALGNAD